MANERIRNISPSGCGIMLAAATWWPRSTVILMVHNNKVAPKWQATIKKINGHFSEATVGFQIKTEARVTLDKHS